MIILGLTGSIGMGKSTTAKLFRKAGCPVFDADAAVHALYAKGGEAVALIRAVFPDAIENDAVNRALLAQHMKKDPLNLQVLESFIHPMVGQKRADFLKKAEHEQADIVVLDVPLLLETGGERYVDKIAVVTAPYEVQKKRVLAREGMTEHLFNTLLKRQMDDAEKRKRADFIIFTDQGVDFAREQVQTIIKQLKAMPEGKI